MNDSTVAKGVGALILAIFIALIGWVGLSVSEMQRDMAKLTTQMVIFMELSKNSVSRAEYERDREALVRAGTQNFERIGALERRMDQVRK